MFGYVFSGNDERPFGVVPSVEIHKNINQKEIKFEFFKENCKDWIYFKEKIKKVDIEGQFDWDFKKIEQNDPKMQEIPK